MRFSNSSAISGGRYAAPEDMLRKLLRSTFRAFDLERSWGTTEGTSVRSVMRYLGGN